MGILRVLCKIFGWPSVLLFFKPKVLYENKKKTSGRFGGKAIIASNHKGAMDFLLFLLLFFWRTPRCLVGETLYDRNAFMRFWLRVFGCIRVDRKSGDLSFLSQTDKILAQNGVVEIFPEGRFNNSGELLPFSPTAVYMSLRTGAPVIPVYHEGNYGIFKRERVVIGQSIFMRDFCQSENPSRQELEAMTEMLKNKITELKNISENAKKKKQKAENGKGV